MSSVSPRYFVSTLGTLRVLDASGAPALADHGHQRRRIALLAVLAASGNAGRSRDQLLGLFWPEVDQARGRHSLEQLLYSLRNALGPEIFSGPSPLRLNPEVVDSDVAQFVGAIDRGDLRGAVSLYRGRFADGFYLGGAPDFEHWIEGERNRIDAMYAQALEKLAASAEQANDFSGALEWRSRLATLDPLSSKFAAGLIRTMMFAGDHSSALQHAERYQELVAKELGTGVGPAMAALVAEVRERAKTESVVVRGSAPAPRHAAEMPPQPDLPRAVPIPAAVTGSRSRRLLVAAAIILVVTIGVFAGWRSLRRSSPPEGTTIAVLPLANLSGDQRDLAIADGITEELIGTLSRIDGMTVIARTSAFAFRNSPLDVRQIAESLHVSHVLEGGVQKIGDKLRVQIRLIDARDGSTRWSQAFDRNLDDLFIVQGEIAAAVARELNLRFAGSTRTVVSKPPTRNIAAYELYLRGNDPTLLRNDSTVRVGLEYFRQAVALDSSYAAAWAGIARMHLRLRGTSFAPAPQSDLFGLATAYAAKALSLDSMSAEAHGSVGLINLNGLDFAAAEVNLTRAVSLDPVSARLREWLFIVYDWQDRHPEMLAEARRAVELDPLSPTANATLAHAHCINGQPDSGLVLLRSLATLRPPLQRVATLTALCHGARGNWQEGINTLSPPGRIPAIAIVGNFYGRLGNREKALEMIRTLEAHRAREGEAAFEIAAVYAGLGEKELFFQWLERAAEEKDIFHSMTEPLFDLVKDDPRYDRLVKRSPAQKR